MKLRSLLFVGSRRRLMIATAVGLLAGLLNTGMIAFINESINGFGDTPIRKIIGDLFMCLAIFVCNTLPEFLLNRVGQGAIVALRREVANAILRAPFGASISLASAGSSPASARACRPSAGSRRCFRPRQSGWLSCSGPWGTWAGCGGRAS